MADNVNIIVQDTINDIVVNAAVVVETIDINVQAAVDVVDIVANPNNYVVNINRIIGEQVQSDWTQNDNQAPDYIKNKPTIPAAQVNSDWNATSGVAEILNKPTIPTATSDLTNDGEDGVNPFITAADIPPVTGFVPYTGADQNVNLGNNDLYVNEIFLYDGPNDNYGSVHYTDGNFHIEDGDGHPLLVIEDEFIQLHKSATIQSNLFTSGLSETRDHYLPNQSGTIALTSDIPSLTGYVQDTRTISTSAPLSGGGDLSANRTLSISQAATAADGYLSSTDWNTFNGKQAALVSGTNIKTINGASVLGSGDLVVGGSNIYNANGSLTAARTLTLNSFPLTFAGTTSTRFYANGNLGVNQLTDAGFKLDVNGTARFGATTLGGNTTYTVNDYQFTDGTFTRLRLQSTRSTINAPGVSSIELQNTVSSGYGMKFTGANGINSTGSVFQFINNYAGNLGTSTFQNFIEIAPSGLGSGSLGTPTLRGLYVNILTTGFARTIAFQNTVGDVIFNSTSGNTLIGTTTNVTSSKLTVDSTTQGFLPPRMTTTQKNAIATPAAGLVVYDTTLNKLCVRTVAAWEVVTSI